MNLLKDQNLTLGVPNVHPDTTQSECPAYIARKLMANDNEGTYDSLQSRIL